MYLPQNTTCQEFYGNSALNLTGFILVYTISKCLEGQDSDSLGGDVVGGSRGVDEFVTKIAIDYFTETKQVIVLYDESWEINSVIQKLGTTTRKSFVLYFLPSDETLALRIKSKPADHFSHKMLPKATCIVAFVKDHKGFMNVLERTSLYPWWAITARLLVLVKEKSFEPTKGILNAMEAERIFNGVVVTEISGRDNGTSATVQKDAQAAVDTLENMNSDVNTIGTIQLETVSNLTLSYEEKVFLQLGVIDPYPAPGQPKHNFIARWGNGKLETKRPVFLEKIDNLRGFKLRVCTFEFPPLVIKNERPSGDIEYTGLEMKILDELAKSINFTYEIYEPPEGEKWGIDGGNGSWNGLLGEVADNRAQIGFASVFLLDQRETVVDVTDPYDQDSGCFAVPRPEALQHWLGLVLPFSWQVWACFLSMALISGPMFSFITRPLKMDASISVGRGIMYALGAMVSVQRCPKANSSSLRGFIIAWLVFCWMSCIIYRVSLIVSLTVGPSDYKIDTISQLIRSGLEWGGFEEVLKTFSNTSAASTKSERDDKLLFDRFVPLTNIRDALDRVANDGDFAVLDSGKFLRYAANGIYFDGINSKIHVAKECPTNYNVGFVTPIGSPYLDKINTLIRRFQNAGLIEKWLSDVVFEAAIKNPNRKSAEARSYGLNLNHLKLCFVLVLFGNFFGFISFCTEYCVSSYQAKKKKQREQRKGSRISESTIKSISTSPSIIVTDTNDD